VPGHERRPGRLSTDEPTVEQRTHELTGDQVEVGGGRQHAIGLRLLQPVGQHTSPLHADVVHQAGERLAALRTVQSSRQQRAEVAGAQHLVQRLTERRHIGDQFRRVRHRDLATDGVDRRQMKFLAVGELAVDRGLGHARSSRDRLDGQPVVA